MKGDMTMSNKKMNDSAKLRFTYGIIFLVIAGLLFTVSVCIVWLTFLITPLYLLLECFIVAVFIPTIDHSIACFIETGKFIEKDKVQ